MEFTESKIVKSSTNNENNKSDSKYTPHQYQFSINLYIDPPEDNVIVKDATEYIEERLNILKEFNKGSLNNFAIHDKQSYETLDNKLSSAPCKFDANFYKLSKQHGITFPKLQQALRRDHISHFLLRIYYCRTDELRKWFIQNECDLLKVRLNDPQHESTVAKLLETYFKYEKVEDSVVRNLKKEILWYHQIDNVKASTPLTVYRMPFEEALDLVKTRKVYLENGYAYLTQQEMIHIVCNWFRAHLSKSLAMMLMELPFLGDEAERLIPRLDLLHKKHIQNKTSVEIGSQNESGREIIKPEMIDTLAKESFPPCMKNIHEILRREHHLRHYGRLHYSLFLKSIGLNLDDAIIFFRDEFTKNITPERFQKEYQYNIRYNYGKEGKRINISSYSCNKIINENAPGPSETHGCPFHHFDEVNLKNFLQRNSIHEAYSDEILTKVKEKNYVGACASFFNCKHPVHTLESIYHPKQYYTESRKALKITLLTPPNSLEEDKEEFNLNDNELDQIMEEIKEEKH